MKTSPLRIEWQSSFTNGSVPDLCNPILCIWSSGKTPSQDQSSFPFAASTPLDPCWAFGGSDSTTSSRCIYSACSRVMTQHDTEPRATRHFNATVIGNRTPASLVCSFLRRPLVLLALRTLSSGICEWFHTRLWPFTYFNLQQILSTSSHYKSSLPKSGLPKSGWLFRLFLLQFMPRVV